MTKFSDHNKRLIRHLKAVNRDQRSFIQCSKLCTVMSAFLVCWLVIGTYADDAKKHVTIAIFPCTDQVRAFKRFRSLVTYLEQETGFDISLVVPTDSIELETGLKNRYIHFAFITFDKDPTIAISIKTRFYYGFYIRVIPCSNSIYLRFFSSNINSIHHSKSPTISSARSSALLTA